MPFGLWVLQRFIVRHFCGYRIAYPRRVAGLVSRVHVDGCSPPRTTVIPAQPVLLPRGLCESGWRKYLRAGRAINKVPSAAPEYFAGGSGLLQKIFQAAR